MLDALTWEAWTTLGVIALVLVALVRGVGRPDLVLLGSLAPLLVLGILTPEEAFAGLSNSAVLTVAALFVVAAGVERTEALAFADRLFFPRSSNVRRATAQLMGATAAMSAFLNNTPVVAMLIPRVQAWCEAHGVPPSKLMIPLSYAAIVGGMTTLIGTSTNLLVAGLMEASGVEGLGLFDLAWVGVPAALAVLAYFALVGHRFLPDRSRPAESVEAELADCLFEVRVAASPLAGRTVEAAGLRALGDAYLAHVRTGDALVAASPETVLRAGDVLTFRGSARHLETVLQRPGLQRVVEPVSAAAEAALPLFEAVVAPSSELVGRSLREVGFRERYHGVVLGVRRRDASVPGALGHVPIEAGDLLFIEAADGFNRRWGQRRDEFYLVAPRHAGEPPPPRPQHGRGPLALGILAAVVAVAALDLAPIVVTSFVGALAVVATGCLGGREARQAVDVPVLLVIAAALGLGKAIETTGLAAAIADGLVAQSVGWGPMGVVAAVYLATSLLTEMITNNAAAALMIGVGLAAAPTLGVPPEAFGVAVAVAASASFLTPIGYQTNLMVMAAGGYRFGDYFRTGLVVNVIVAVVALLMIQAVWL